MRPYTADFKCQDAPVTCLGVSTETDTGIHVTASESPPHPRPYCGPRVWRSFDTDLGSRTFEAPFASLMRTWVFSSTYPTWALVGGLQGQPAKLYNFLLNRGTRGVISMVWALRVSTQFLNKTTRRLTGTRILTAPGFQIGGCTPTIAQESPWSTHTTKDTASTWESVIQDHSTMAMLICTMIGLSAKDLNSLWLNQS